MGNLMQWMHLLLSNCHHWLPPPGPHHQDQQHTHTKIKSSSLKSSSSSTAYNAFTDFRNISRTADKISSAEIKSRLNILSARNVDFAAVSSLFTDSTAVSFLFTYLTKCYWQGQYTNPRNALNDFLDFVIGAYKAILYSQAVPAIFTMLLDAFNARPGASLKL